MRHLRWSISLGNRYQLGNMNFNLEIISNLERHYSLFHLWCFQVSQYFQPNPLVSKFRVMFPSKPVTWIIWQIVLPDFREPTASWCTINYMAYQHPKFFFRNRKPIKTISRPIQIYLSDKSTRRRLRIWNWTGYKRSNSKIFA